MVLFHVMLFAQLQILCDHKSFYTFLQTLWKCVMISQVHKSDYLDPYDCVGSDASDRCIATDVLGFNQV